MPTSTLFRSRAVHGEPDLAADAKDGIVRATFTVRNTGRVSGKEVAQVYVSPLNTRWEAPKRLAGFQKVDVKPGAAVKAGVTVDPRLLAMYDSASRTWKVAQGDYRVTLAASAADPKATSTVVHLEAAVYDVNGKRVAGQ
jgi:beta-glucosidase